MRWYGRRVTGRACRLALAALLLLALAAMARPAQVAASAPAEAAPQRETALVYRVNAFNGRGYVYTMAPPQAQTIYALAGQVFVLNPRMTQIYYWPATSRYLADWDAADEEVTGTLEVTRGGQRVGVYQREPYVLTRRASNPQEAQLATGAAAQRTYDEYRASVDAYWAAIDAYQAALITYEHELAAARQAQGEGKQAAQPHEPERPAELQSVTTAPDQGYQVALPEGKYEIALRGADGGLIPGSRRELVVFTPRRTGVSYMVLPEERWTLGDRSDTPEDTIYARPAAVMYLQPFEAAEMPAVGYARLADPQETEVSGGWTWVDLEPMAGAALQVQAGRGAVQSVPQKPYFVRQLPGSSLGYEIVEYDAATMPGVEPSFTAFKVVAAASSQVYLVGSDDIAQGSARSIRLISRAGSGLPLYLPAFALALLAAVILYRGGGGRAGKE